jgi:hypothetical protein
MGSNSVQAKKNARNIPATVLNVSRRTERYGLIYRKKICAGDYRSGAKESSLFF